MAKNCPNCGLINPDTAERCDCGYDFVAKTRRPARSEVAGRSNRTRKVLSDFLVGALEPQLHLGWLLAVLGLLVVAIICAIIIAHQPEMAGVLIYFAIVVLASWLIARRLEAKRREAMPGTLPYTWGYFYGLTGLIAGLLDLLALALGIAGPENLAEPGFRLALGIAGPENLAKHGFWLALALLRIPTGYYIVKRKKWAWVMGTGISLSPVVWITNAIYASRRSKDFTG